MDSRDLDGSCVIVTGGGSGIGRAIVDAVVAQGGRAAVWDVDEGALRDCAGRHGDAVTTARIDVSDEKAVRQAAERLTQDFAAPTHLVNNAGITGKLMPLVRMETDQIDRVLGVNLKGMLYCMSAFLAHRAPHPHAAIVNLASIAGADRRCARQRALCRHERGRHFADDRGRQGACAGYSRQRLGHPA